MKRNFLDLEKSEIEDFCRQKGLPAYRAGQIFRWQARGIASFDELTDLSKELREALDEAFYPGLPKAGKSLASKLSSSRKAILTLKDGEIIESVLMRHRYGLSACLSTQAGCRMGCRFCASTGLGFHRHLSRGELLGQLLWLQREAGEKIDRIDLMGIGEPLENLEEVLAFIRRIRDEESLNISPRKLTLSTCGLVPAMNELAQAGLPLTLAVSLHAPNQEIREKLMPVARLYRYDELLRACKAYFAATGRRVSFEYALFKDVNDRPEHAEELARRLADMQGHVNLIPANAVAGTGLLASGEKRCRKFQTILERRHIQVTLRRSLGQDIDAACGQLRRNQLSPS